MDYYIQLFILFGQHVTVVMAGAYMGVLLADKLDPFGIMDEIKNKEKEEKDFL